MNGFKEINATEVENSVKLIGSEWMLITAGDGENINCMTASWGSLGVLWNKNVCTCFIRPQRHTFGIVEKTDRISFSFFGEGYRKELSFCGSRSGRDTDKFAETGLSVSFVNETPIINEARLVLVCRKLYADFIKKENFVDPALLSNYKYGDFHKFYVCEIEKVLLKAEEV